MGGGPAAQARPWPLVPLRFLLPLQLAWLVVRARGAVQRGVDVAQVRNRYSRGQLAAAAPACRRGARATCAKTDTRHSSAARTRA